MMDVLTVKRFSDVGKKICFFGNTNSVGLFFTVSVSQPLFITNCNLGGEGG